MATILWQITPELEQFRRQIDAFFDAGFDAGFDAELNPRAKARSSRSPVSNSPTSFKSVSHPTTLQSDPIQTPGQSQPQDDRQPKLAPWKPAAAILETDDCYQIQVQLPGIDAQTLDLEASCDRLTIRGNRPAPQRAATENVAGNGTEQAVSRGQRLIHSEFRYGSFERSFSFAEEIQPEAVSANYDQGILNLSLPKRKAAADYKVKVQIAAAQSPASESDPELTDPKPADPKPAAPAVELDPVW